MRTCSLSMLTLLLAGCMASAPTSSSASPRGGEARPRASSEEPTHGGSGLDFPVHLVTGPGAGPALYGGAGADEPALGYVSEGVPLEVTGPIENGRVPVRIVGGIEVRAHMSLERLYAYVQRRGRVRGTNVYVAGGDRVRVLGFEAEGRVRVEVSARRGREPLGMAEQGSYPIAGLGSERAPTGENAEAPGAPCTLAGLGTVTLHESPRGPLVGRFPTGTPCMNVRVEDGAHAVLVGTGPYALGYVAEAPIASGPHTRGVEPRPPASGVPARLDADAASPLTRVAAGTRVVFDGRTVARLGVEAYARVLERYADTGEADVFVAVDDDLALRGLVPLSALSEISP